MAHPTYNEGQQMPNKDKYAPYIMSNCEFNWGTWRPIVGATVIATSNCSIYFSLDNISHALLTGPLAVTSP